MEVIRTDSGGQEVAAGLQNKTEASCQRSVAVTGLFFKVLARETFPGRAGLFWGPEVGWRWVSLRDPEGPEA